MENKSAILCGRSQTPIPLPNNSGRRGAAVFFAAAIIVAVGFLLLLFYNNNGLGQMGKGALSGVPSDNSVPPAPFSILLTEGQFRSFTFKNHNILVNYTSASPDHSIDVTVDGVLKSIGVARNSQCVAGRCASSWTYKGMNFSLEPVTRKNDGLSFDTWDTSELRLSVS